MKIILLTVAILLLVGSSKQQDDLLSQLKRPQLKQKTQDIVELKETVCGCDESISSECLAQQKESHLQRLTRSIEQPISALWEKIKWSANDEDEPANQQEKENAKSEQQKEALCKSEKLIKCSDESQKIKIIKADMSNSDKNRCPASNVTVDEVKNVCQSTRIQSTELAQKLCDDKNECRLSLDMDGFENVCECASQKYLELTYLCISSKPESNKTDKTSRKKRQINRFRRPGGAYGGFYGGFYGGLALSTPLDVYDYLAMSGYGVGFPRFGLNQRFPIVV